MPSDSDFSINPSVSAIDKVVKARICWVAVARVGTGIFIF